MNTCSIIKLNSWLVHSLDGSHGLQGIRNSWEQEIGVSFVSGHLVKELGRQHCLSVNEGRHPPGWSRIVHNYKMRPSDVWCRQFQAVLCPWWGWRYHCSGWVAMFFFPLLVNCLFRWSLLRHQSSDPDSHCDPLQHRKGIFLNYQIFLAPLRFLSTTPGGADGCVIWFYQ